MKIKFKRITALFAALAIMITALPLTIIPISAAGTDGESTEYASAYREMASKTNQKFGNSTEIGLLAIISEKAKESLRR